MTDPSVYAVTSGADDALWRENVRSPSSLMQLARNPYMLTMLAEVYARRNGVLPENRGELFDSFVSTLLAREKLAAFDPASGSVDLTDEGKKLLIALEQVAYAMQVQRAERSGEGDYSAATALPLTAVKPRLSDRMLYLAVSASLLTLGDEVRFTHQLLQEYFAARYMRGEIAAGRLKAADIWLPERWWERTNWEEAAVLLAGLYSDDCTPVLDWLADANPEVAGRCIARSGAHTPEATKARLRDRWLPRLTDLKRDPQPQARAAVGRALGMFRIDGKPADHRKGVSLRADGLPDLDWVEIPAGAFTYGEGKTQKRLNLPRFFITRCLITYAQFQAFVDAPDGFYNPLWWDGLAADDKHKAAPGEQWFKYWTHPRERVSWYDAIAFCRWLSAKLGYEVRLPTEQEWEKAARGTDGRLYPYGKDYDPVKGNTSDTDIGQTSAVGIFPNGASPYGVLDLSGNLWGWCLNRYNEPDNVDLSGTDLRVVRGGSWNYDLYDARAVFRSGNYPDGRDLYIGFRVVVSGVPVESS